MINKVGKQKKHIPARRKQNYVYLVYLVFPLISPFSGELLDNCRLSNWLQLVHIQLVIRDQNYTLDKVGKQKLQNVIVKVSQSSNTTHRPR